MKTKIWIAALIMISACAFGQDAIFKGKISQILPEGALFFVSEPSPHLSGGMNVDLCTTVFLQGDFSRCIDGQRFKIWAKYVGPYRYIKVSGANATTSAFTVANSLAMQDGIYNY